MIPFSWERRIQRAEQLAKQYPASAEILRIYAEVARFQQTVFEKLKAQPADRLELVCLEPDLERLLRLVQRTGPAALAEAARMLERERPSLTEMVSVADGPEHLLFFSRVLLQPYMECKVNRNAVVDATAAGGRCPACGELPQCAVLRGEGEGAKRRLLCSLCSTEWEFRRLLCPNCGEENHEMLPVYKAAEFDHVRVEACDRCHVYIKAVDLTKNGLAIPCVDEIATVSLDVWAEENGYHKLQRNVMGL